jgi:hypothetical protein
MIATCKTDSHTTSDCGQLWSKDFQQFFLVCPAARAHMLIQTLTLGRSDVQSFTSWVYSHTTWQWDAVGSWLLYQQLVLSLGLLVSWSLLRSFRLPSSPSCWFRSVVQVWLQLLKFIWVLPNSCWSWGVLHWCRVVAWGFASSTTQRHDQKFARFWGAIHSMGETKPIFARIGSRTFKAWITQTLHWMEKCGKMWFPFKFPQNQNRASW